MRSKRKIISMLLAAILLFSTAAVTGTAAVNSSTNNRLPGEYETKYPKAYAEIVKGIENGDTRIKLYDYSIEYISTSTLNNQTIGKLYAEVLYGNHQFFYIDDTYSATHKNGRIYELVINYRYSKSEIEKMKAVFQSKVNDYLALIKPSYNDEEKALVFHDAILENCAYDTAAEPRALSYTAYGALVNGVAVCQGYSLAYAYLLEQVGIQAVMVSSESMVHAWNMVLIDGSYYHVDLTWDDFLNTRLGASMHMYFLLSSEKIATEIGGAAHYGWQTDLVANNKKYDTYFWRTVNSKILYADGGWYYADQQGDVIRRDLRTHKKETLFTVEQKWKAVTNTSFYDSKFTCIAVTGNTVYFNSPDKVYKYDITTGKTTVVYTLTNTAKQIFGIEYKNGKLYGTVKRLVDDPESIVVLNVQGATEPTSAQPTTAPPETKPTEPATTIPPEECQMGDVTMDGSVDIKDVTAIQKYCAEMETFNQTQLKNADMDNNGIVNVVDATYLQKVLAGILSVS